MPAWQPLPRHIGCGNASPGGPGGTRLFSAAAVLRVPYFASIVSRVVRMEPGFAEVTVPKWFFVKSV